MGGEKYGFSRQAADTIYHPCSHPGQTRTTKRFENVFLKNFKKQPDLPLHDVLIVYYSSLGPPACHGFTSALVHVHGWLRLSMDNAFHSSITFATSRVTGSTNECTHPLMGLASMEFIHPRVACIRCITGQGWEAETLLIVLAKISHAGSLCNAEEHPPRLLQIGTLCSR